jgi:hypothetical protein
MLIQWLDERIAGQAELVLLPEGEPLPYFPQHLSQCVCFLGFTDRAGAEHVAGSAFWICRAASDELRHELKFAYLVTAAHVLDAIRKKSAGKDCVLVRVNTVDGASKWIRTYLGSWKVHSDSATDIAVLKFGPLGEEWDHICWPDHAFVNSQKSGVENPMLIDVAEYRIELGDEVYFPGLFWPHKGKIRNLPIVRFGNISCLRGEKVSTEFGMTDAYLVEARSIGGLSGSPVFINLISSQRELKVGKNDAFYGRFHLEQSPSSFRLLGLMHGHFKAPDMEPKAARTLREWEKINMGIAIVIPAEKILEAIQENYMAEEQEEIAEYERKKRSYAAPDSVPATGETQTTSAGLEIPVPSKAQFFDDLQKASRKKD